MSNQQTHGSTKEYVTGFIFSVILTIIPAVMVINHMLAPVPLIVASVTMAVLQFLVQLFFFMHIREGEKPLYNVMALVLGGIFVVTIVGASVWIMSFNSQIQ